MDAVTDNLDLFLSGYWRSWTICLYALVGSLAWGTVLAMCRVSPVAPLRAFGTGYVLCVRNTPLTIMLFFTGFVLPVLEFRLPFFWLGLLGLVLYSSAFVCEAVRSGINAVPTGQSEAARAVGLTFDQSLRSVILPQAMRTVVPPLGSVVIAMFKNSAVLGAFGAGGDLFSVSSRLTSALGYAITPVLLGVLVGYLAITLPTAALLSVLERRVAIAR